MLKDVCGAGGHLLLPLRETFLDISVDPGLTALDTQDLLLAWQHRGGEEAEDVVNGALPFLMSLGWIHRAYRESYNCCYKGFKYSQDFC